VPLPQSCGEPIRCVAPPAWFTTHELNQLFDRAGVPVTLDERAFLDKLRAFVL
jgi:hypothetical protein